MIAHTLLVAALTIAVIFDIRKRIIPDSVHIILLAAGLASIFLYGQPWLPRITALIITAAVMLAIALRLPGLGGGDIKMAACLVFAMEPPHGFYSLTIAFLLALVYASAPKRKGMKIPLAPFFAIGSLSVFVMNNI